MSSELYFVTQVFKMKLTKYLKIQICEARCGGLSIRELCKSFGLERKTIVRILHRNLILPVEAVNSKRLSSRKQRLMNHLSKNQHLTLEQINLRFPKIFNYCCMERAQKVSSEFYAQFVDK